MNAIRQLRNSSIFCVATIALALSSNAYAQTIYKVADQGTLGDDNFGMVMGLNNQGWTQNMDGEGNPPVLSLSTTVLSGRAVMNIDGHNIDLGTLEERTVGPTMAGSTIAGKTSVCPKHLFQIQTVKTFAPLART